MASQDNYKGIGEKKEQERKKEIDLLQKSPINFALCTSTMHGAYTY